MNELIFVKQNDKDCMININNVEHILRHNGNEAEIFFTSGISVTINNYDELKEFLEEKQK